MVNLLRRASDPHQYDRARVRWEEEGLAQSPTRLHFHHYLRRYLPPLDGQTVLDIGSGTGHLFPLLRELGATRVVGIEPSRKNVRLSRRFFPELRVYPTTVEQAQVRERCQTAVIVMAFEHMPDIGRVLRRIRDWLEPGGHCYAIVGSFRYHTSPRFDYTIHRQTLSDGSAVVGVERPFGILYDIIRPLRLYAQAGRAAGLPIRRHIPLRPSPRLMRQQPKYRAYARQAISQLLIFQRP